MKLRGRAVAAAIAFACVLAALALATTLGRGSAPSTAQKALATKNSSSLFRARESLREGENAGSEADKDYASRAYPATEVTFDQTLGAIADAKKLERRVQAHAASGTPSARTRSTSTASERRRTCGRHSGRAASPRSRSVPSAPRSNARCTSGRPAAASGARRTRSRRRLPGSSSPTTSRRTRSARSPSTRTIRRARRSTSARARRTGAATASRASASSRRLTTVRTGRGSSGSLAAAGNRAIGAVAVDPTNANHLIIATRTGTRGVGSNGGSARPTGPATGIYRSNDGGATFTAAPTRAGTAFEAKFDPTNPNVVYASFGGGGLLALERRRHDVGADLRGHAQPLLVLGGRAPEREDADLPLRLQRRRPVEPGVPRRRRGPARGDADGESARSRTPPGRACPARPQGLPGSRAGATATGSAATTWRSSRRPTAPTWSSSRAS